MIVKKFTDIKNFQKAFVWLYEFFRDNGNAQTQEDFLARFIQENTPLHILAKKDLIELSELNKRIDIFMDGYGASPEEERQIETFEAEAEFLLYNAFKSCMPLYIAVSMDEERQFKVLREEDIKYEGINKLKEYFI